MTTKVMNKCYDWWESLTEEEQFKIMTDYYPTEVKEDTDVNKMFGDMPDNEQMWIHIRSNRESKIVGKIPIDHDVFNQILVGIGRRKFGKITTKIKGEIK